MRIVNILCVLVLIGGLSACGKNQPSQLSFQGKEFQYISTKESSGGKFDIVQYNSGTKNLILITPHSEVDLDGFSKVYTQTFIAQGFKFESVGSRHIGVHSNKVVYLAVAKYLNSVSILLVENYADAPKDHDAASDIFRDLEWLD